MYGLGMVGHLKLKSTLKVISDVQAVAIEDFENPKKSKAASSKRLPYHCICKSSGLSCES